MIISHLRGLDAGSVIQELGEALRRGQRVPDLASFCQAVLSRESLVSTEMEAGMAFPHGRLPDLRELSFALGRSDELLAWGAGTVRSVRLFFLIAVPANDFTQYLLLISGLARLARDQRLVQMLHAAPDHFKMLEVLQQIELPIRSKPAANNLLFVR